MIAREASCNSASRRADRAKGVLNDYASDAGPLSGAHRRGKVDGNRPTQRAAEYDDVLGVDVIHALQESQRGPACPSHQQSKRETKGRDDVPISS